MLLMPRKIQDKDILRFSPNIITDRKIAISSSNDARIEEIVIDSKNKTVTKNCSIGYVSSNNIIDILNKMQIVTDMSTGERISYNLSSSMPSYDNNYNLTQSIGYFYNDNDLNFRRYEIKPYDKVYCNDHITGCKFITDFDYINGSIFAAENLLQIDHGDLVGVLEMFFTQWSFNAPFISDVIIDTEHSSFNIPKFIYFEKIMSKENSLKLFDKYAKELSTLCTFMSDLFNNVYKRKFRIMIHNSPFITIIKIKDIENKEMNLDVNVSASDHLKTLVDNRVSCKWYCNNDALMVITSNKTNKDITLDALDTIDYINSDDIF